MDLQYLGGQNNVFNATKEGKMGYLTKGNYRETANLSSLKDFGKQCKYTFKCWGGNDFELESSTQLNTTLQCGAKRSISAYESVLGTCLFLNDNECTSLRKKSGITQKIWHARNNWEHRNWQNILVNLLNY